MSINPRPSSLHVQVRPADLDQPSDADSVVTLLDAYAADPMGSGEPLPQDTRDRLIPALRQVPGHLVLLAFAGEQAVGLAICFQGFSTFRARPLLNIHDLTVLPDHRGRGVATALLAAVEAGALRRGCCKLALEAREDNPAAACTESSALAPAAQAADPLNTGSWISVSATERLRAPLTGHP